MGWFSTKKKEPEKQKEIISEPVMSIVKTFKEKGRWKLDIVSPAIYASYHNLSYTWQAVDTKTNEHFNFKTTSFYDIPEAIIKDKYYITNYFTGLTGKQIPLDIFKSSLPTWMNDTEKQYLTAEANKIIVDLVTRFRKVRDRGRNKSDKVLKENQVKERNRLIKKYCN